MLYHNSLIWRSNYAGWSYLLPSTQLTGDGNLMKTTEIIKPKLLEFWQNAVIVYAVVGYQGDLSPGSEKPNAF
jgi:hypothetical protein